MFYSSSLILFCGISISIICSVSSESCYYTNIFGTYTRLKTCPTWLDRSTERYCCGSGSSQYCCDYGSFYGTYSTGSSVAQIVGGALSAIFFIGVFVAIMVCCCSASCPLYRRRQNWGRVHHVGGQGHTVVVTSQTQHIQQPHMRPQVHHHPPPPVMAPPYQQYAGPQNPAYPPPPPYHTQVPQQQYGVVNTNYGYPQGQYNIQGTANPATQSQQTSISHVQ